MSTEELTGPSTIEVRHEIIAACPRPLLARMCKQMNRWFDLDTEPDDLQRMNFRVRVDDRTPPEWMLLFQALQVGHWNAMEIALESLRKVRNETIRKRTVSATLSEAGGTNG